MIDDDDDDETCNSLDIIFHLGNAFFRNPNNMYCSLYNMYRGGVAVYYVRC